MADNKDLRGPQDASRINVHEDYELRYWSKKFDITSEELRKAVEQVGATAQAVEAQVNKNRR